MPLTVLEWYLSHWMNLVHLIPQVIATSGYVHQKVRLFFMLERTNRKKIHPLTISHSMTFPLGDTTRFRHEFDWTGTRDVTGHCSIPMAIDFLASHVEGGWPAIMKRNHELAIIGRNILCESLGITPPCPDDMITCIATLPLPSGNSSGGIPLHEPDPLHRELKEKNMASKFQCGLGLLQRGRYIRISHNSTIQKNNTSTFVQALKELL